MSEKKPYRWLDAKTRKEIEEKAKGHPRLKYFVHIHQPNVFYGW
jgi:hypothetical protein